MPLLTRIQLKDYEPGEFTDSRQRTCQETLDLIDHFPWQQQREHLAISLTNPSVTIEGPSGDFLKLATYYHDKFILYYLDKEKRLYVLPIATLPEAYPFVRSFFDNKFTTAGFQPRSTLFANNRIHFEASSFTYTMRTAPTLTLLSLVSVFWIVLPVSAVIISVNPTAPSAAKLLLDIIALVFIALAVTFIALFVNHYRASKGKILTISRGNPLFYFGDIDHPDTYDKKDIREILRYGGYRGVDGLKRTEMIFKDGRSIDVSGLIAGPSKLQSKFPGMVFNSSSVPFPFIPLSASAPS